MLSVLHAKPAVALQSSPYSLLCSYVMIPVVWFGTDVICMAVCSAEADLLEQSAPAEAEARSPEEARQRLRVRLCQPSAPDAQDAVRVKPLRTQQGAPDVSRQAGSGARPLQRAAVKLTCGPRTWEQPLLQLSA